MLPLHYTDADETKSSFRMRQRASTPGTKRRNATTKQPSPWNHQQDHVTIVIPDETDNYHHHHRYDDNTHDASTGRFVKRWKIDYENRLDDYHSVFRTPHHVTDAEYQKYVRGEHITSTPPKNQYNIFAAQFCTIFSFIASFILCFIGFLLDTQALYIPGSLPAIPVQSTVDVHGNMRNTQVYEYLIPNTERLYIATTAYRTSGLYLVMCGICAIYCRQQQQQQHGGAYQSIPDSLPTFTTRRTKHDTVWDRMIRRLKRHARFRTRKQEKKG